MVWAVMYTQTCTRNGLSERTPFTQQLRPLLIMMPPCAPLLVLSIERSSTPEFLMVEFPHHAPGLCDERQFDM